MGKIEEPIKTSLRLQEVQVKGRMRQSERSQPQQVQTPLRVQGKKEVQVQVRPQQVQTSIRIQGKEEVQVKVRPQQVQTPLRQAQMLGDAKAPSMKSWI